jgi:hypothetical protein
MKPDETRRTTDEKPGKTPTRDSTRRVPVFSRTLHGKLLAETAIKAGQEPLWK